jgi:hypothetical protein
MNYLLLPKEFLPDKKATITSSVFWHSLGGISFILLLPTVAIKSANGAQRICIFTSMCLATPQIESAYTELKGLIGSYRPDIILPQDEQEEADAEAEKAAEARSKQPVLVSQNVLDLSICRHLHAFMHYFVCPLKQAAEAFLRYAISKLQVPYPKIIISFAIPHPIRTPFNNYYPIRTNPQGQTTPDVAPDLTIASLNA